MYEERARAFDQVSATARAESRRKTRTLAGNYQILRLEPRLLLPTANAVWLQYTSHKIGRLIVPWSLVAALASNAAIVRDSWFYALALMVQLGFYGLALLGGWNESRRSASARPAEELPDIPAPHGQALQQRSLPLSGG